MQSFVSMEEAFGLIGDAVQDRLTLIEQVTLSDAVNRYVAEPVVAQLSIPPHTNSARDGFALSAEQSLRASRGEVIPIAMEIRAGDSPDQLPADDSAGGLCHAGLRPHRRGTFGRLRRFFAGFSRRPHQRLR